MSQEKEEKRCHFQSFACLLAYLTNIIITIIIDFESFISFVYHLFVVAAKLNLLSPFAFPLSVTCREIYLTWRIDQFRKI
jgi:hypothetical protein